MKQGRNICISSLLLLLTFLSAPAQEELQNERYTAPDTVMVGEPVTLEFMFEGEAKPPVTCFSSLGAFQVTSPPNESGWVYHIQSDRLQKAGQLFWSIVHENKTWSGSILLCPGAIAEQIETYCGPESITVGTSDFSMLVASALDRFGNPLISNTELKVQTLRNNERASRSITMNDMIAVHSIFPSRKPGQIVSTVTKDKALSSEIEISCHPGTTKSFSIDQESVHSFADGHQLMTFWANDLRDQYDNVVSDGTNVKFIIESQIDGTMQASGNSISGQASVQVIHPEQQDIWSVSAFVGETQSSNTLVVPFAPAVARLPLSNDPSSAKIVLGPVTSFAGQWVPDGMRATFTISQDGKVLEQQTKYLKDGQAELNPSAFSLKPGSYLVVVRCAGLENTLTLDLKPK